MAVATALQLGLGLGVLGASFGLVGATAGTLVGLAFGHWLAMQMHKQRDTPKEDGDGVG